MAADVYRVAVGGLPVRTVRQASLLLGLYDGTGLRAAVLDVDTDEFVQLPSLPPVRGWRPLSLSPDGTHMMYRGRYNISSRDDLFLYELATAEQVVFNARVDGDAMLAALSPDGSTIATLSIAEDLSRPEERDAPLAAVGLIDVATTRQRRLWGTPGTWSAESVVSWSPDGNRVAVTYLDRETGLTTIVLDTDGHQIGLFPLTQLITSGNGAWLDTERVVTGWDDENGDWYTTVLTVTDGGREILAPCTHVPVGRTGNRLITHNVERSQFPDVSLLTTDLHNADPQPFLSTDPRGAPNRLDTWMTPYEAAG